MVITITTTPIEVEKCAIIINADGASNFDYAYGSYRIPGSDEWLTILDADDDYHLDNWETVYVPKGAEVMLSANSFSGDIAISPSNFVIIEDTMVYFTSENLPEYELNIQTDYADGFSEIYVYENNTEIFWAPAGTTEAHVIHNGGNIRVRAVLENGYPTNVWEWTGYI